MPEPARLFIILISSNSLYIEDWNMMLLSSIAFAYLFKSLFAYFSGNLDLVISTGQQYNKKYVKKSRALGELGHPEEIG